MSVMEGLVSELHLRYSDFVNASRQDLRINLHGFGALLELYIAYC